MASGAGISGSIDDRPRELFFRTDDGRIVAAGPWARDFVGIGRVFAGAERDPPLTLALSLPILDFAGPLIAAGFIAELTQRHLDGGAGFGARAVEQPQKFRELCALPAGTPVLLRLDSGKTVHAVFLGLETVSGEPWAVIRFQKTSKGAGKEFINEAKADRVTIVAGRKARTTEAVIGRPLNVHMGLAEGFFRDRSAFRELIFRSVPECALIGVLKRLDIELRHARLLARNGNGFSGEGPLQDIVRAANFMRTDQCPGARLFPIKAATTETGEWSPALVIYCGSSAYLNQSARFSSAHHAALLSPTERNFDAAVAALNEAFLRRRGDVSKHGWTLPEGVAAMGFQRRRNVNR